MDAYAFSLADHFGIAGCTLVRGADCNVVGFDAKKVEALLDGDSNCAAPAPEPNQEIRVKIRLVNVCGQPK